MTEGEEDLDSFYEDADFLSAVAAVETRHMRRRSNSEGCDGPLPGADCKEKGLQSGDAGNFQGLETGQNYAGKRKDLNSQWGGGAVMYSPEQPLRGFSGENTVDKRRRRDDESSATPDTSFQAPRNAVGLAPVINSQPEGEYMAALRGSNSELWKKTAVGRGSGGNSIRGGNHGYAGNAGTAAGGGRGAESSTCYKCGLVGHWSKDCSNPKSGGSFSSLGGGDMQDTSDVPERLCPCGAGACNVMTANTEKNQGRRFYRCPLKKDEGQCSFFEWCDAGPQSFPTERGTRQEFPQIQCQCGAGPCATLTAKTERNMGRSFYKCPLPQGQGCTFFQWCDEAGKDSRVSTPGSSTRGFSHMANAETPSGLAGGSCYKCGQGGHWARDCPSQSNGSFSNMGSIPVISGRGISVSGGQSPARGTCFKCGQEGHWSRDCANAFSGGFSDQSINTDRTPAVKTTNSCYKCGGQGHWSTNCPSSEFGQPKPFNSAGPATGSCYKCGDQGHWANKCPVMASMQR